MQIEQVDKVTRLASVRCSFCDGLAVGGSSTCLRHAALFAEQRRREHPSEKYLYMGVLPHRQRRYWPDGKGRRHDG